MATNHMHKSDNGCKYTVHPASTSHATHAMHATLSTFQQPAGTHLTHKI